MEKSRAALAEWSLKRAEEYLASAEANLGARRMFPAAEEIFKSVEASLESMLYSEGVQRIAYPGKEKEFTGRLALQFLVKDNLVSKGRITPPEYVAYKEIAAQLHGGGYQYGKEFDPNELEGYIEFAGTIFSKARRAMTK